MIQENKSTIKSIPTSDLKVEMKGSPETTTYTYPVKQSQEDKEDYFINVRASTIRKCRKRLIKMKQSHFHYGEFFLAIFTLCVGAIIGAWVAGITMQDDRAFIFYTVLPVIGAGCIVAYFYNRHLSTVNSAEIASEILIDLPDPENKKVSIEK